MPSFATHTQNTQHTCDSFPVRPSSDIPSHLHFQWANLTVYECDAVAYECADSKVMTTRLGNSDCTIKDVCIFCTIKKNIFEANGQQRKMEWNETSSTDRRLIYRKAIISDRSWILIMTMIFLHLILSLFKHVNCECCWSGSEWVSSCALILMTFEFIWNIFNLFLIWSDRHELDR